MRGDKEAAIGPLLRAPLLNPELTFDAAQQKVLAHSQGTLIVLGGPGTGKTTLAAECAVERIRSAVDPLKATDSILLLTYGRERASELRDQIALRTGTTMKEPIARTFHSLAFSILHMSNEIDTPDVLLMSGPEQEFAIREVLNYHLAQAVGDPSKNYWPAELSKALETRGFVRELRDLIMRSSERGLSPSQLREIAAKSGEKYWQAAAIFWERYLGGLALEGSSAVDSKMRIDPSEIIMEAVSRLGSDSNPTPIAQELRAKFSTIIVDEYQESDPAQRLLLRKIRGNDLIIFADGDSAVGRFRGSDPDTLRSEFADLAKSGKCEEIILKHSYRNKSVILDLTSEVADQFRSVAVQRERTCVHEGGSAVSARLRSESEQAQFIAYQFRKAHLIDGVPWREMAVIVRSPGATAQAIRRAFAHSGVPVSNANEALMSNSAIAPILLLAKMATSSAPISINDCQKLILSELGGGDAISLRRIRRALLSEQEQSHGDEVGGKKFTSAELIVKAIDTGEVSIEGGAPLLRIADLLEKARRANKAKGAQAEDLLWAIWNSSLSESGEKLSLLWQRTAVRGGNRGAMADRDLDAMMQLFDAARRHAERFPYSRPSSFIDEILRSEILGDVITTKGQRSDVVEILTVHSAKGREWDLVAVAGLQDGAWPNLRQRGSLLGSERLVEMQRHSVYARQELEELAASGLAQDERRLLYVALSRAKSSLIVSAVQREDDEPSRFFDDIDSYLNGEISEERRITEVPRPLTESALVAQLRREVHFGQVQPVREKAAGILQRLAQSGIAGADVESWLGVAPMSTTAPIVGDGEKVRVSPSALYTFDECGLRWFLESSGGRDGDSSAQSFGNAIHGLAEKLAKEPDQNFTSLKELLNRSWSLIDSNSGWISRSEFDRAVGVLERVVNYHNQAILERPTIYAEARFRVEVENVIISGSVDRLEIAADGKALVVDFKTSKSAISPKDVAGHMQMRAYQLGVTEREFFIEENDESSSSGAKKKTPIELTGETLGASLLYVGTDHAKIPDRDQPPLTPTDKAEVIELAKQMGGSTFTATVNKNCQFCAVSTSCPLQIEGRTVIG